MLKLNNKDTRVTSGISGIYFTPSSSVSVVEFKQVNVCSVRSKRCSKSH